MTSNQLDSREFTQSSNEKWRRNFFLILSMAGIPVVFVFAVIDIMERDYGELFIDIINTATLTICFVGLLRNYSTRIIYLLGILVLHITVLAAIAIGAGESTALFWAFILPAFAFTFLTRTMSIMVTSASSLILLFLVLNPGYFGLYNYGLGVGLRFLLAYGFSLIFSYSFSVARYGFEKDLADKHQKMEEHRDFLGSLLETIPNPVYFKDVRGVYLGCNKAFEKLAGKNREDFLGKTIFDVPLSRHSEKHWEEEQELIKNHGTVSYQYSTAGRDGHEVCLIFTKSVFFDKAGEMAGVIGVVTDVTELKNTQDILEKSEIRFRTLVEQATDAIFLHDINGKIVDVNQRACQSLGYPRHELLQMSLPDIAPSYKVEEFKKTLERVLKGEEISFKGTHRRKDGSTFPIEVSIGYYPSDDESLFIGFVRDITERTKAEKEQKKLIAKLQTALSEMKTLRGSLTMCSMCKKVKDDKGYWNQIEAFLAEHTYAELSHSICPDCAKKGPPDIKVHQ